MEKIIKNTFLFSSAYNDQSSILDYKTLRDSYLLALDKCYPEMPVNYTDDVFSISDIDENRIISDCFSHSELDDMNQDSIIGSPYTSIEKNKKILRLKSVVIELKNEYDEFSKIFDLLIHSIIIRPGSEKNKAKGGTTSGSLGVIWLTVCDRLSDLDLKEILVHELTHTIVFLDEHINRQFIYDNITAKNNYSLSAILCQHRPVDKSVHSILVCMEIILARKKNESFKDVDGSCTAHPNNTSLLISAIEACEDILNHKNLRNLTTVYMIDVIHDCLNLSNSIYKDKEGS